MTQSDISLRRIRIAVMAVAALAAAYFCVLYLLSTR